jgi:hypothetical protein
MVKTIPGSTTPDLRGSSGNVTFGLATIHPFSKVARATVHSHRARGEIAGSVPMNS